MTVRELHFENDHLRFEIKVWRFIAGCFLGSLLAFVAWTLLGGFHG